MSTALVVVADYPRRPKRRARWTAEQLAELQRRIMMGESYKSICAAMGGTPKSLSLVVKKYRLASRERIQMNRGARLRGKPIPNMTKAMRREETKRRWQDPEFREKTQAAIRAAHNRPATRVRAKAARDAQRGFSVPPELEADYRNMVYTKKVPAREAAAILGIEVRR